jgi:hypothetical protein
MEDHTMLIEKVEGYRYDGKFFDTEQSAVEAALDKIGRAIVRDYHANMLAGLLEHRDELFSLLGSHQMLTAPVVEFVDQADLDPPETQVKATPWQVWRAETEALVRDALDAGLALPEAEGQSADSILRTIARRVDYPVGTLNGDEFAINANDDELETLAIIYNVGAPTPVLEKDQADDAQG